MELGSHGAGVVWCERPAWASVGWRDDRWRAGGGATARCAVPWAASFFFGLAVISGWRAWKRI